MAAKETSGQPPGPGGPGEAVALGRTRGLA